jgi:hypothetical protein
MKPTIIRTMPGIASRKLPQISNGNGTAARFIASVCKKKNALADPNQINAINRQDQKTQFPVCAVSSTPGVSDWVANGLSGIDSEA